MTPLEKALAQGEDVTDTPLGRALRAGGEKVTAEAPKSEYPEPKSFRQTDEELGTAGAPRFSTENYDQRDLGLGFHSDNSPEGLKQAERERAESLPGDAAKIVAGAAAGGLAGKVLGGALAARAAPAAGGAAKSALATIAGALKHSSQSAILGTMLGHGYGHGVTGALIGAAAPVALKVAGAVAPAAGRVAAAALPVTGAAIGAGLANAADETPPEPAPFKGVFSNAVDQLRSSTNPRAADLLRRIDAAGTGAVTQTTLGAGS